MLGAVTACSRSLVGPAAGLVTRHRGDDACNSDRNDGHKAGIGEMLSRVVGERKVLISNMGKSACLTWNLAVSNDSLLVSIQHAICIARGLEMFGLIGGLFTPDCNVYT